MKILSHMFVWWTGFHSDVKEKVKCCSTYQSSCLSPPPASLDPWKWPNQPWTRLHLDFTGAFVGHMFFILIDAQLKWIEVALMS